MSTNRLAGYRRRLRVIRDQWADAFVTTLKSDAKGQIGLFIVATAIFVAVFADYLALYDPLAQSFPAMRPPGVSLTNPLGTDNLGRDLLSRVIIGTRMSLGIAILGVTIAAVVGISIGVLSGFYGGWIDDVLMRVVDIMWAYPYLVIAILLVSLWGQGVPNVLAVIAFIYIDDFARVARGEVLGIRDAEFVTAGYSIGMTDRQIIVGEIFPNIVAPLIVQFTIFTARAIIIESTLSFLGLGVSPATPTWGGILGRGRDYISQAWWIVTVPGIAIAVTVIGINMLGDLLRDSFDVRRTPNS